jgi:hypothetical protein
LHASSICATIHREESPTNVSSEHPRERRKYHRIQAPVFCRPARVQIMRRAIDVSMGGVRVYSDLELETGDELKMELFLPDGHPVEFTCRVAWIERLPKDAPAKFDVGLSFVDADEKSRRALQSVLAPPDD